MIELGSRLRLLRELKNYTQKHAAETLGIDNVYLSRYESGTRRPDYETLVKLADFYEVRTDYLLGRDELPFPETDEKDIAKISEKLLVNLDNDNSLTFDGVPMDEATRELVKVHLENNLRFVREMTKRKFTIKKEQDED